MIVNQVNNVGEPRPEQYIKINAYSIKPSWQYIFTLILFLLQVIVHSVFIPRAIVQINHPILIIFWALTYVVLAVIIYDYFYITCMDPADKILKNREYANKFQDNQIGHCKSCQVFVQSRSYHCGKCNRCTEDFDHHCKFLNSCIGSRNYEKFLRIVMMNILFDIICIAQSVWVIAGNTSWSRWGSISLIVISLIIMIALSVLLGFHVYLNCIQVKTTVQFWRGINAFELRRKSINTKYNPTRPNKVDSQQQLHKFDNRGQM